MMFPLADILGPLGSAGAATSAFDPASIAGLQLWLKADALALADGDMVATWPDASGRGHDFVNVYAAPNQAIFKTAIFGALPAVRVATSALSGGDLSAAFPAAATLFVVAAVPGGIYTIYSTAANSDVWRYSDGSGYLAAFRTAQAVAYPAAMPGAGVHLFSLASGPARYEMYLDGVSQGSRPASYLAGTTHVLGYYAATGLGNDVTDLAEILAYDRDLSDADRMAVENYLKARYQLS